jgi:FkbM family methyltransferase
MVGLLWHPHQKLWNGRLNRRVSSLPGGARIALFVARVDSVLLAARAIVRRARRLGPTMLVRSPRLPARVLYVDCGVHRDGQQIRAMTRWFGERVRIIGFEANPKHYEVARTALAGVAELDLRNEALVGPECSEPVVRLYMGRGDGKGDSLFSERGRGRYYEDVAACHLSEVLRDVSTPILVRMNIEGAEVFVIEDLVKAGMAHRIAGFYGMWDDLSKIDPARDVAFRRLLRDNRIAKVTFNDRDMGHRLREWSIRYDMVTSMAAPP